MEFVIAFIVGGLLACLVWRPPTSREPVAGIPSTGTVDRSFALAYRAEIERLLDRYRA